MARVQSEELDLLRDALAHWRKRLLPKLPDDTLTFYTLTHRHHSIVAAAQFGLPDLAELYSTKDRP